MYQLRIHRTLASVRSAWLKIEADSGTSRSAYQSYYVNAIVKRRLFIYGLQEKYSARYLEVLEDRQPLMIIPLCKYRKTNNYCSLGKFNGFQVYDFIYTQKMTSEKMRECLAFVLHKLKLGKITLYNIPHDSLVYSCLHEGQLNMSSYEVTEDSNDHVCIDTEGNYDQWHGKLSKSTRQNLRTAYNRMNTDGVVMQFEIARGQRLKANTLDQMIELYCKRHSLRYQVETSTLKKLYLRYLDFSTVCLRSYCDNFYAVVYMNGKIAAFMSGLTEKAGSSVVIPRLSIDDEFNKYSPGMVLINETVREFTSNMGIRFLDLSKGAEKYKLSMGGQLYHTYNITISRTEK